MSEAKDEAAIVEALASMTPEQRIQWESDLRLFGTALIERRADGSHHVLDPLARSVDEAVGGLMLRNEREQLDAYYRWLASTE